MEYKQVILVRKDLRLSKGKMASQVSHGSVESTLNSNEAKVKSWKKHGMKKVILKLDNQAELLRYKKLADEMNLANYLVRDAGKTEIESGTITCLAIGPDKEEIIDKISGNLKML